MSLDWDPHWANVNHKKCDEFHKIRDKLIPIEMFLLKVQYNILLEKYFKDHFHHLRVLPVRYFLSLQPIFGSINGSAPWIILFCQKTKNPLLAAAHSTTAHQNKGKRDDLQVIFTNFSRSKSVLTVVCVYVRAKPWETFWSDLSVSSLFCASRSRQKLSLLWKWFYPP